MLRLIPKTPSHPATRRFNGRYLQLGNPLQHSLHRRKNIKSLLMTMPMHQSLARVVKRLQIELQPTSLVLTHKKLFKQHREFRQTLCLFPKTILKKLIPQRQQTRRLQPNNRHTTLDKRSERIEHPAGLVLRLIDEPCREESSSTTKRTLALNRIEVHGITSRFEHLLRSACILRLDA